MVLDLIRRVRDRGLPVILISHNMPHVFEVADRIHIMRLGRRVAVVTPAVSLDVRRGGDHDRRDGDGIRSLNTRTDLSYEPAAARAFIGKLLCRVDDRRDRFACEKEKPGRLTIRPRSAYSR